VEELQVEMELQRLNNHTPEEDQTDQEDGDDEDEGDQATNQPPDLTDYQLVRDRELGTRTKPLRFQDESNMVAYAFVAAEEEDTHEPLTYQEEVACEDSSKWKAATKEKMDSLRKKTTRVLVYHPAGQKLVSCKWLFKIKEGIEDDMLIACKSKAEIGSTKSLLKKEFDMKYLGEAKKILDNGKSVKMPLGGHFKLSLKDCPEAVKWLLKYLRGTINVSLVYGTNHGNHVDVTGFVDSDYAKDPDKGRSINGYAFLVQGCVVSWKATLQHVVALSTTKEEYIALTEAVKEAIWLRALLEELGVELNTVAVNCDNQGAIHLSQNHVFHERTKHINNHVFHERTKHINVRYHFIKEVLEAKTVKVLKVGTEHNAADALTNVGGLGDPKGVLYGSSSSPLYQVNLSRPCTKKEDTVSLTVGADPTIGLRREN
nr:retrovirus-related Pol polyprotein from transposon TNT 1-94 [Tanacetum cinerariifolium]